MGRTGKAADFPIVMCRLHLFTDPAACLTYTSSLILPHVSLRRWTIESLYAVSVE